MVNLGRVNVSGMDMPEESGERLVIIEGGENPFLICEFELTPL